MTSDGEKNYRLYMMVLSVGLFLTFGAGFVVGALTAGGDSKSAEVVAMSKIQDPVKATQEALSSCYKFMSGEMIRLVEAQNKLVEAHNKDKDRTRAAITAAIKEASKGCSVKKQK